MIQTDIVSGTSVTYDWPITSTGVIEAFSDGVVTVDKMLDYPDVGLEWYIPSKDAIEFILFIRLVLGEEPENSSPKAHYFLIDCIFQSPNVIPFFEARGIDFEELKGRTVVLCTREFAKSVMVVYLILYMGAYGKIPNFGNVRYGIYVSDSMRNNVKTTMETVGKVYMESKYLRSLMEDARLVQDEINFIRKPRTKTEIEVYHQHVNIEKQSPKTVPGRMKRTLTITGLGAAALPLTANLFTESGYITMGDVKVGDEVYGADGKLAKVTQKSEIFNSPMYNIELKDGRVLTVSDDHINSVAIKDKYSSKLTDVNLTTTELLNTPLTYDRDKISRKVKERLVFVRNCEPVQYPYKKLPIDPYTLGLLLGDGSFKTSSMNILHSDKPDFDVIRHHIPYEVGAVYKDKRTTVVSANLKGLSSSVRDLGLSGITCGDKFIPSQYFYGSITQRLELLSGLIDSDGSIYKNGRVRFSSISEELARGVVRLTQSLGGTAFISTRQNPVRKVDGSLRSLTYLVEISLDMPVSKLPRKLGRQKFNKKSASMNAVMSITEVASVPSQCIAIDNEERQYIAQDYFRTHNTGGRGSRDGLARPDFAIFDDLIPNEKDAESDTILANIESTIEADILKALSGNGNFAVAFGTPYKKNDPIYRRIEEGSWLPVVFPRAAKPPIDDMKEEDFQSVWPDRHSYKQCRKDYRTAQRAKESGNPMPMRKLMQENYLRISSDEDRMVTDQMIDGQMYSRKDIQKNLATYNLYMTTDFTTTGTAGSDLSGIAIWAVSSNSDYFLLDLSLRKMELQEQYDEVFRMVSYWGRLGRGVTVGVETDGQQKAHIFSLKKQMQRTNNFFMLGKQKGAKNGSEGILSRLEGGNKHWRFKMMMPEIQNKKIWFPEELESTSDLRELFEELRYVSYTGFGSHYDDGCDLISQLGMMDILYPMPSMHDAGWDPNNNKRPVGGIWARDEDTEYGKSAFDSYT